MISSCAMYSSTLSLYPSGWPRGQSLHLNIEKSIAKRSSSILEKLCIFYVCTYEMMGEDATVEIGSLCSMLRIESQSGRGQQQH